MENKNNNIKTCIELYQQCPYFPDMSLKENQWYYDDKKSYNVPKENKVHRCMYDNHPIDWNTPCPKMLIDVSLDEED